MKDIFKYIPFILITLQCTQGIKKEEDPVIEKYLAEVLTCPLEFKLSTSENYHAWGRAQSFVGKYSAMKIQVVSDFIINTYNPSENAYGFNIVKTPMGDSIQFLVECFIGENVEDEVAERNAHLCAYYIKTGIEPPPGLFLTRRTIPTWLIITGASVIVFPVFFILAINSGF